MPEYNNISKTKDLTQKQSQNVIKTSYEAEDVLKNRKSLSLEAPAKSEKKKETKKARTDDLVNPVARKELRRRQTNKMKTGLEHTQFDLVIRDLGREHIVSEDVQMEKGWIRAQMKMLEKDADKRKLEEIRKERLALEELKREKQKEFDEAHNTQAHSARISGFMDRADTAVRSLLSGKRNRISCMPKDSLLTTEYGTKFKERISSKTRDKKSKNKRSRLYLKRVLFDQVREAESSYKAGCYTQIRDLMMNRVCDDEDYSDLSHFMIPGEAALNRSLLDLYLGKDRSKEGEGGFAGQDIQTALDKMLRQIFTTDLTQFNFESDSAMMKNSAALEHLLGQICAFDRMAEKHDYFNTLDDETKHRVNDRLGALRSIANYYQIRKQILTNQYYMTHYNDEMTMDIIWDRSDPKSEIGELLLKAQVLGRTMMRLNGMDKKKLAKYKEPSFSDENKAGVYRDLKRELMSDKGQKDLLANAYRTERIFNDENRRKITLPETEKDIKLKEEFADAEEDGLLPEDKIEAKAKKEETEDKERFLKAEENRHEEKKQEEKQEEKAVEEEKKEEKKQEQPAAAYKKSNILPAKLSVSPRWKENERPTKERFDEVMGPVAMKKELTAYLDSMNNSEFVKNFVNKPAEEKALKERISSACALIMKGKTLNEDQVNRAYADALNKLAMQKHLIEENTNLLKRREDERSLVMRCLNNDILDNYERRFTTVSDKEAINLLMMGKNHRGGDEILTNNISDLDLDTQKEISEFKFEDYIYKTDEEFISSYAEKYDKLCKMAKFDVLIDKRDDRVTYGTYLKTNMRIRSDFAKLYKEHYEDKLKLMSSPYYALIPQDELKGFLDKNGNSKIARIKDPALADFLRTYRKVELGKPSLSKKSQTFKDIVANGCDVQMKKDCATVKRYMKIAEEGQKIAKKSGDKDYQFKSENKEDNLLKMYRQHQELVKSREIKEDVEFVNSRIYGESEQPFMKNSAETLDKLEKTIISFITKGEIYGVKLRLEDRPGLERLIKKWVAKRRIAIRANDASLFCIPMAFGLGCDFNNDDFAETKEGEWLKKFKAGSKPEEISKDLNEKRRAYAEATTEIYKFLHTNGYPMSPDRKYEKRLQDKEKIKEIVERGDYPVITVNGVEITSYNYKKSALTHMAKLGKEYRFEGEDGERITGLLKECSDIEQRRLVLHTMYGDVGGEKNLIYVIGMREITAEEIRVKTELFPLLTGKVEGIEEAVSERVKAAIEKKQKGEKEKDTEKQKIEQEFTVITEEEVNREEIDRILLNKPLIDTGLLSPARAKDLKSDVSFKDIMKPGELNYRIREGTEEISEAAATKIVSNADGSFEIKGLALNRVAMVLRCSPGEGRSNKELISILKRLDAKQNMIDNKLTKEEANKQLSDAMYELKHIYYIHLKRVESTYGKKFSQMHPYDVIRMLGTEYAKVDTDFSMLQDTIQMLECGRFFDMNKKEDKEFFRLAHYYNTVFTSIIKTYGMDYAASEISGTKVYEYNDKDRENKGEINEKGLETHHFMTEKDIGGVSITAKEQKEYIKDLRKRAREEGWDDKLFGRYLDPKVRMINRNVIDLNNYTSLRVANDALKKQFEGEKVPEADMKKMQEVVKASYEYKRSLAASVPVATYDAISKMGRNKTLKGINYKGILTLLRPIKLDKDGYPLNKDEKTKIDQNHNDLYFLMQKDLKLRKPFLDRIAGEARDLCFTVDQLRDPAYILKNKTKAIRHLAFMHNAREVYESNSSYYQKDADPAYRDFMSKLMTETNYVEYSSFRIQQALFGNGLELSYTGDDPVEAYTVKFEKGKGKSYEDIKKQNESLSKADRKDEEDLIRKLVDPFKKKGAAKRATADKSADLSAKKNRG